MQTRVLRSSTRRHCCTSQKSRPRRESFGHAEMAFSAGAARGRTSRAGAVAGIAAWTGRGEGPARVVGGGRTAGCAGRTGTDAPTSARRSFVSGAGGHGSAAELSDFTPGDACGASATRIGVVGTGGVPNGSVPVDARGTLPSVNLLFSSPVRFRTRMAATRAAATGTRPSPAPGADSWGTRAGTIATTGSEERMPVGDMR
jgi:hypothetical protein